MSHYCLCVLTGFHVPTLLSPARMCLKPKALLAQDPERGVVRFMDPELCMSMLVGRSRNC